jgi:hypothetical protein
MDSKLNPRSGKKSAGTGLGNSGDRKKNSKSKKKKDKRRVPAIKGNDSTDIPSPDVDSEVVQDADVTLTDQGWCLLFVSVLLVYIFIESICISCV